MSARPGGRAARADAGTIHNPLIREPLPVILPALASQDSPLVRATKLARFMEARWPRIHLRPDADALGRVAAFNISIDYDRYAGDERVWEDSVHQTAGDLREASVELLKLSLLYFPKLAYATVWEDSRLMFFWSKRQIEAIGPAKGYREFHAYQALTRWAEYQPPLLEYARKQAAASTVLGR